MRTRTKLTPQQATANAACAAAPRAVVKAAAPHRFAVAVADRMSVQREQPKADRGGMPLKTAELLARDIHGQISEARYSSPRTRKGVYSAPLLPLATPQLRLTELRRGLATVAAKLSLRLGANYEISVTVAAENAQPSYNVQRDRRWLGNDDWGTDFWIHAIRLPRGWMTAVKQVGRLAGDGGLLNDGRFVLDAIHVHTLDYAGMRDSPIFEVDVVRQGRGIGDIMIERVVVRVWPGGHETYHPNLKRAIAAKAPQAVVDEIARERSETAHLAEDMSALEMEAA